MASDCTLQFNRRSFLMCAMSAGAAGGIHQLAQPLQGMALADSSPRQDDARFTVEARFYEKLPNKKIKCRLCPRECKVGDRERGYCGVRENHDGVYYTLVHSRVCAAHVDPVEKKPLFHYLPGTLAFSIATAGCNVNCKFCQNWNISQARPEQVPAEYMPPQRVAELATQWRCPTIAYTYSEPVVFSEFLMDAADAGHEKGIRSIVVSNGYIQEEALRAAYGKMDAVKIDLKSFSESYYQKVVTGELKPVLETLVTLRKMGKWTEMVYLVVPTLNDSETEFTGLARWVKENLGPDVPLHFTQFHPDYLLKNLPITPIQTLERAKAIADAEGLHYVYIGNVPGHPAENTYCPKCRRMLVERTGFEIRKMLIKKGACSFCKHPIPGVWHV
jgi:pyruvate formate lyase activating enzyme